MIQRISDCDTVNRIELQNEMNVGQWNDVGSSLIYYAVWQTQLLISQVKAKSNCI